MGPGITNTDTNHKFDDQYAFRPMGATAAAALMAISNHILETLCNESYVRSSAIDIWLSSNHLRLNPDKTQFIWLGGRLQLNKIDTDSLHLRFPHIRFSSSVRDLGIV